MNKKNQNLITALYCRLSIDDGPNTESMSISNQKQFLQDYADRNGLTNCEFYVDDGYTGRNFNRPGFQRLVRDIEAKLVSTVITKDLSRLGRNYIEVGMYTDVYFPRHNIRFIALNDGVDSLTKTDFDITPFKNIMNDMYSRDISRKVATGMMIRSRQGKFTGGPTPFGLIRDPADHGHLIIDPVHGPTVRYMYDLALEGLGAFKIARRLEKEKWQRCGKAAPEKLYRWEANQVIKYLRNPFYKGAHVVCKTHQKGIRSNTYDRIPRDEWEIIEGVHEAIVSVDEWNRVQEMIASRPRNGLDSKSPYVNIFGGIIRCNDCGSYMTPKCEKWGRADVDRTTKKPRAVIDKTYYTCGTYVKHTKVACSSHKIEARDLQELVLADIRHHAQMVLKDPESFLRSIAEKMQNETLASSKEILAEKANLIARNQELDTLYMSLYEDKTKGILPEKRFVLLADRFDQEQLQNNERIKEIDRLLQDTGTAAKDIESFFKEISKCADIDELTDEIVHKLIKEIRVGSIVEIGGERTQEIRIIYAFVGNISDETICEYSNGNYKKKTVRVVS